MATVDKFVPVFTGFEVNIQHLRNIFEEAGIDSVVRNDSDSALRAGFGSRLPGQAVILVPNSRSVEAEQLVKETFPELTKDQEE